MHRRRRGWGHLEGGGETAARLHDEVGTDENRPCRDALDLDRLAVPIGIGQAAATVSEALGRRMTMLSVWPYFGDFTGGPPPAIFSPAIPYGSSY